MRSIRTALWEVRLEAPRVMEEAAAAAIERALGEFPVIYSPAESGRSRLSVFMGRRIRAGSPQHQALEKELNELRALGLGGAISLSTRAIAAQDWQRCWRKFFRPISIGKQLLIKPSWSGRRAAPGQAVVILDPGLSFGTGQHPTTQFCLRQIVRRRPTFKCRPRSFLDVGTGSGILAIAAAKLGYRPVRAFDCDPVAVRIARANVRRNGVSGRVRVAQADLRNAPAPRAGADLICANLLADVLLDERERWPERLRPGGALVLAGILAAEFRELAGAYQRAGFRLLESQRQREWESGVFSR